MAQGRIQFGIGFQVDKSGLNTLQTEFQKIQNMKLPDLKLQGIDISQQQLDLLKKDAKELESIFLKSYNFKLNTVDLDKLKANLNTSNITIASFQQKLQSLGPMGEASFAKINAGLRKTQTVLKETHPLMDKMRETFANTVRWTIASAALNSFTGSIQKAWSFTKQLDTSLNNIRIVTGKSAEEMERFAVKANQAAKGLGATTKSYTDAALIYYQQGLSDAEVQQRTNVTLKAANVTGQNAQAVSEQLTAVWNGYKVSAQETELYIDKLSAVAATTAADLEELSTGMSKVASAANIMGVDIDQLNAQLATIISVTREAPESIGTALKTVYARMSDIQAGLDTETTLGEYTAQMEEMGIRVLDAQGNLRDMGDVVEEIGNKWNTLNRNQQTSLAQTIAGTRQYSRMMALFDNWDMYEQSKTTSQNSAGTLGEQNEIALDTLDKKLEQLTASTEKLYLALFDNDAFKALIDGFSTLIDLAASFVDNLGGAVSLLPLLSGFALSLTSKKISSAVGTIRKNHEINKEAKRQNAKSFSEVETVESKRAQYEQESGEKEASLKADTQKLKDNLEKTKKSYSQMGKDDVYGQMDWQSANEDIKKQEEAIRKAEQAEKDFSAEKKKQLELYDDEKRIAQENYQQFLKDSRARKFLTEEEYQARQQRHADAAADDIKIKSLTKQNELIGKEYAEQFKQLNEEMEAEQEAFIQSKIDQEIEANNKIIADHERVLQEIEALDKQYSKDTDVENETTATVARQTKMDIDFTSEESVENARIAMVAKGAELKERSTNLKNLGKAQEGFSAAEDAEDLQLMQETVTEMSLEDGEFDLSDEAKQSLVDFINNFKQALAEGNLDKANEARRGFSAVAGAEVSAEQKKNKKAIEALDKDANKKRQKNKKDNRAQQAEKKKQEKESKETVEQAKKANQEIVEDKEKTRKKIEKENAKELKDIKDKCKDEQQTLKKTAKEEIDANNTIIKSTEEVQEQRRSDESLEDKKMETEEFTYGLTKCTAGILKMGAGMSMVSQLPSIISDDNLSGPEKFLVIITTVLPALGSLANGFQNVVGGLGSMIKTVPSAIAGLFGLGVAETSAGAAGEAGAEGVEELNKAMKSNPYLLIIGAIIMGIIAALTALFKIFGMMEEAYNRDANAAKAAAESAKELADAYKTAKQEYDNLKQTISDYKDAYNGLSELTKGTTAWREEIQRINDTAYELMQKYPELASKFTFGEGGVITFDEGALEEVQEQERLALLKAQNASIVANQAARSLSINSHNTDLTRKLGTIEYSYDYYDTESAPKTAKENAKKYNYQLLQYGQIEDEKELLDDLTYALAAGTDETKKLKIALKTGQELSEESKLQMAELAGISAETEDATLQVIDKLTEEADAIVALTEEIEQNNALLKAEQAMKYSNTVLAYGKSEEDAAAIGGMLASTEDAKEREAWLKKQEELIKSTGYNEGYLKEYLKFTGEFDQAKEFNGDSWTDIDGKEHPINWDTVAEQLALARYDQMIANTENIQKQSKILDNLTKDLGDTSSSIIKLTLANQAAIEAADITDYTMSELEELVSLPAEALGELTEEMQLALEETYNRLKNSFVNMEQSGGFLEGSQDALVKLLGLDSWEEVIEKYSFQTTSKMMQAQQRLAKISGQSLEDVSSFLSKFENNFDNLIQNVDWQSENAFKEVIANAQKYGAELDYTDEATFKVMSSLATMNGELLVSSEKFKEVIDILSDLSEFGDAISADEYSKLFEQYGSIIDEYFVQMKDGTYGLVEAASSFYDLVNRQQDKKIFQAMEEELGRIADIKTALSGIRNDINDLTKGSRVQKGKTVDEQVQDWWTSGNATQVYGDQSFTAEWIEQVITEGDVDNNEDSAQKLLAAYLSTSNEDAKILKNNLKNGGWDIDAMIADMSHEDWDYLTEGTGYTEVELDPWNGISALGWDWHVAYKDMAKAVRTDMQERYKKGLSNEKDIFKRNPSEIYNIIDSLLTNGIINQEKATELKDRIIHDPSVLYYSGEEKSEIEEAIEEAIKAYEKDSFDENGQFTGDTTQLQAYVRQHLQFSTSEDDFKKRLADLQKQGYDKIIGEKNFQDIVEDSEKDFGVAQEKRKEEENNQRLETRVALYNEQETVLERLRELQDDLYGQDAINNLNEQNKILEKQIENLKEQIKLEKTILKNKLTFKTGVEYDSENNVLKGASDTQLALLRLYGYSADIKEEELANVDIETVFNNLLGETFKSTDEIIDYLSNGGYAQLLNKINSIAADESLTEEDKTKVTDAIAVITEGIGELISSETSSQLWEKVVERVENNLEDINLELEFTIDKEQFQREYNDFMKSFVREQEHVQLINFDTANLDSIKKEIEAYDKWLEDYQSKHEVSGADVVERFLAGYDEENKRFWQGTYYDYNNKVAADGYTEEENKLFWALKNAGILVRPGDKNNDGNDQNDGLVFAEGKGEKDILNFVVSATDKTEKLQEKMESISAAQEYVNSLEEQYLSWLDSVNGACERQVELIEAVNSTLDHQRTKLELIYGDKASKYLSAYYKGQAENLKKIVEARKNQYDFAKLQYDEMTKQENIGKYNKEQIDAITSQYIAAQDSFLSSINETAQIYLEEYTNKAESLLIEFEEKITDGIGLEKIKEEWDWMQEVAGDFLDDLDTAFGIESVINSYNKAANSTTDVRIQQKINDLKEQEIKILREKAKLSQYDLDRAQKQLDILQARIALEDAQQNKSQMRLMRNANGTYSYQYVAEQSKIDEAREKLNQAQQDLVNLDEEQLKSNTDKALDILIEMVQELEGVTDPVELQNITEKYIKRFESYGTSVIDIIDNIKESVDMAKDALGIDADINRIYEWFDGGAIQTITDIGEKGLSLLLDPTMDSILEALADYLEKRDSLYKDYDFDATAKGFTDAAKDMQSAQEKATEHFTSMNAAMKTLVEDTLPEYHKQLKDWADSLSGQAADSDGFAKGIVTKWQWTTGEDGNNYLEAVSAATGMYTGEWGPEGKLAVLHEKELVLNKQDTANILSAVDLVRSLGDSMMNTMAFMSSGYAMSAAAWELAKELVIEQTVNINAEFPNATDRAEIEAAFEELVGLATQHAYENKRG